MRLDGFARFLKSPPRFASLCSLQPPPEPRDSCLLPNGPSRPVLPPRDLGQPPRLASSLTNPGRTAVRQLTLIQRLDGSRASFFTCVCPASWPQSLWAAPTDSQVAQAQVKEENAKEPVLFQSVCHMVTSSPEAHQ